MLDFMIQKEAQGYSVWSCKPSTGDRADHYRDCRTKREALDYIDRLYRVRAQRERLQAICEQAQTRGCAIVTAIDA